MTWPTVTINQLNRQQGRIPEIERTILFIGEAKEGATTQEDLIILNSQSDIDELMSNASDELFNNVKAAQLNAGQNWQAYAIIVSESATAENYIDAIKAAQAIISVEGVVVINNMTAVNGSNDINKFAALRESIISEHGRWVFFILTVASPLNRSIALTWSGYITEISNITKGIAAYAVQVVPLLWGNEAGALAGRLCNRSVTVADSPARVLTGPLIGMSADLPVDSQEMEVTLAELQSLHDLRCSVPMWYADYEGLYWSDGCTLDVKGGDYQTIENLRVVDKVARRVRLMAIAKIGDRSMNSTPASIAAHETYFARPMREMSLSTQIIGITFPGEVKPPKEGDVIISWADSETVSIYIVVRPYGSPKSITVGIMLDETLEG